MTPARPSAHSAAPSTSTLVSVAPPRPSGTALATSAIVASTSGTFSAKIHRHETESTIWPPTTGPSTTPIAPQAVHAPTAFARSSSGKTVTITASAAGVSIAPATPWSARATTSSSIVGAAAQRIEATPNPPTPSVNTLRSPKMSPSEPPMRINEASVMR